MRLAYAHRRGGKAAVTLRACRFRPTYFSGGFEIDYAAAPRRGRCAELIVWVKGEQAPHRVQLLRVEPSECAGDSA